MRTKRVILLAVMISLVSAITVFLLNGCKVDFLDIGGTIIGHFWHICCYRNTEKTVVRKGKGHAKPKSCSRTKRPNT